MQNGRRTTHRPKQAASVADRSKRWTSGTARAEPKGSQNAQRSYERYLELARAEALSGNLIGQRTITSTLNTI